MRPNRDESLLFRNEAGKTLSLSRLKLRLEGSRPARPPGNGHGPRRQPSLWEVLSRGVEKELGGLLRIDLYSVTVLSSAIRLWHQFRMFKPAKRALRD